MKYNVIKIRLGFIAYCFLLVISSFAQPVTPELKVAFNYDNNQEFIQEILYLDKSTGQEVNSFDIIQNNPYQNLSYFKDGLNQQGLAKYLLEGSLLDGQILVNSKNVKLVDKGPAYLATSFYETNTEQENHILISYILVVLDTGGNLIGTTSTIVVLDKHGEVIANIENENIDSFSPSITADGRYLGFTYGGFKGHDTETLTGLGYKIYDLNQKKVIDHQNFGDAFFQGFSFETEGLITFSFHKYDRTSSMIVINPYDRVSYSKTYTYEEVGAMKEVSRQGVVFKDTGQVTTLEEFQTHFKIKKF